MPNPLGHIVKIVRDIIEKLRFKDRKMPDTPEYIVKIVQDIKRSRTREDVYKILDDAVEKIPGFEAVGNTVFVKDNFQFQCSAKSMVYRTDFEAMKREHPHIGTIKIIDIGNSGMAVIFIKYNLNNEP